MLRTEQQAADFEARACRRTADKLALLRVIGLPVMSG